MKTLVLRWFFLPFSKLRSDLTWWISYIKTSPKITVNLMQSAEMPVSTSVWIYFIVEFSLIFVSFQDIKLAPNPGVPAEPLLVSPVYAVVVLIAAVRVPSVTCVGVVECSLQPEYGGDGTVKWIPHKKDTPWLALLLQLESLLWLWLKVKFLTNNCAEKESLYAQKLLFF